MKKLYQKINFSQNFFLLKKILFSFQKIWYKVPQFIECGGAMSERVAWKDGVIIEESDAKVSVLSGAVKYGASVFEGIRAYYDPDKDGMRFLSLEKHIRRLFQSAHLMRMVISCDMDDFLEGIENMVQKSSLKEDSYLRCTMCLTADETLDTIKPVESFMHFFPYGRKPLYHDGEHICITSWTRIDENSVSPRIKCAANYQNARLAVLEAKRSGYNDILFLNRNGYVAESSIASFFYVKDGVLHTSMLSDGILESLTREVVLRLADLCGIPVKEHHVCRTYLYTADEAFLCGTASEILPIRSVDGYFLNSMAPESITMKLQRLYEKFVRGGVPEMEDELFFVKRR